MADQPAKKERFKADMPQIPGVTGRPPAAAPGKQAETKNPARFAGPLVAIAILAAIGAWFIWHAPRRAPAGDNTPASNLPAQTPSAATPAAPPAPRGDGAVVFASLEELAKPWSSKAFTFHSRSGREPVEAMAVRLPGPAGRVESYWAFSLQEPFGKCQLEYVADLTKLSGQYGYAARHPMVGNPCNGTVYDPLKLGTTPSGAWARGEVVHGNGMRPPIAIELRVQRNQLIATQIE